MLIDTHAHLNFAAFKNDFDEVVKRCFENDIWVINVGTKYETSKKAVEIAQKYKKGIYASVGLHPVHLEERKVDPEEVDFQTQFTPFRDKSLTGFKTSAEKFDYQKYKELAGDKKVVAIGETGLDYYWKPKTQKKFEEFKQTQKEALFGQLKLAEELNLPVIFHCRMAHQDLIKLLNLQLTTYNLQLKGTIHCFTGSWEQAEKYLEMGLYFGFNGIIFKLNLDEIIKNTPLERILLETDCPYLTPPISVNQRLDQRKSAFVRNEPLYLKYIAEKIAKIKGISFEEIAKRTTQNAMKLFRIED